MSQRRRTPPPPKAMCFVCGWRGTPDYSHLRDEFGDVALTVSAKHCPACGSSPVSTLEPPPPPPIQLVRAVREAKLTSTELLDLADAVRDVPAGASPREVAEHAPKAAKFVGIASKLGEHWIEILVAVLTMLAMYVGHQDAERAHRDATQAHQDAAQAHRDAVQSHGDALSDTGALSDDDLRKLAEQIEKLARASRLLVDELACGYAERVSEPKHRGDPWIAQAPLDPAHFGYVDARSVGNLLLGEAGSPASVLDVRCEGLQVHALGCEEGLGVAPEGMSQVWWPAMTRYVALTAAIGLGLSGCGGTPESHVDRALLFDFPTAPDQVKGAAARVLAQAEKDGGKCLAAARALSKAASDFYWADDIAHRSAVDSVDLDSDVSPEKADADLRDRSQAFNAMLDAKDKATESCGAPE